MRVGMSVSWRTGALADLDRTVLVQACFRIGRLHGDEWFRGCLNWWCVAPVANLTPRGNPMGSNPAAVTLRGMHSGPVGLLGKSLRCAESWGPVLVYHYFRARCTVKRALKVYTYLGRARGERYTADPNAVT